ncbi:hypothetical protein K1719_047032 [Acacia pycnantha]|nr:hypothetical protein K1719_047032 [Acacia pycnantha]
MLFICYDRNPADGLNWRIDDEVRDMYEHWLLQHGKVYHGLGTNNKRIQIPNDNLRFIDECNAESRTPQALARIDLLIDQRISGQVSWNQDRSQEKDYQDQDQLLRSTCRGRIFGIG